jgi:hypothetical protein
MAKSEVKKVKVVKPAAPFGGAYFLGMIGAAIHFVGSVDGFWNIVLALLKSAVWPAFLIHRIFDLLRI